MRLTILAILVFLFSCNSGANKTDAEKADTTTNTANTSADVEAQKEALNKQSKECIAIMNFLEERKNAALAAGNAKEAAFISVRIDSAAMENAKIGQKLMALEK